MIGTELLFDPVAILEAFEECCGWAEEITVCTPRIESKEGHATAWRTLIDSIAKVRLCIVGDRFPQLSNLGPFHARGALRLFDDHGRRHRACVFLFRQGTEVRALVGSTRLLIGGSAEGIESVTKFDRPSGRPLRLCAV